MEATWILILIGLHTGSSMAVGLFGMVRAKLPLVVDTRGATGQI